MKIDFDTFIISDTHFGHKNIIKYCDRPEDHDEIMQRNWWRTVSVDDTVLHLGDLTFKSRSYIPIARLPGKKYLILGNHDKKKSEWYGGEGFEVIKPFVWNKIAFTHYPLGAEIDTYDDNGDDWKINIHGHVHNNAPKYKEHSGKLWINVSVEMMNYTPTKLRDILKEI